MLQLARVLKVSLELGVQRKGVIKVCKWRGHVARAADVQLAFRGLRGDFLSSSQAGLEESSRFYCIWTSCCSCCRAQKSEGILGYAQGDL